MVSGQESGEYLTESSLSQSTDTGCSSIYLFLKVDFIIFIYMICMCVCLYVYMCTGQEVLDSLELELQVAELFDLGARNSWPL